MIEAKYADMINAELDGELAQNDRAELQEYLLSSPEARQYRDELHRLGDALQRVPALEPPAELRDLIAEQVRKHASAGSPTDSNVYPLPQSKTHWLKPALSLAASITLVVALIQLTTNSLGPEDLDQVAGSMADPQSSMETLTVTQPGLSATVSISEIESSLFLEIKVNSPLLTSTLISVPSKGYGLRLVDTNAIATAAEPSVIEKDDGSLVIESTGRFEANTRIERRDGAPASAADSVRVQFIQNDQIVHVARLRILEPE